MSEEIYEKLREALDATPFGAPKTEEGVEIDVLKVLYTPEEAEVAASLQLFPTTAAALADQLGRDASELEKLLEGMADKRVILASGPAGERHYTMLPLFPGVFEAQFMCDLKDVGPDAKKKAELFDRYYMAGLGMEVFGNKGTPPMRTLVIEEQVPAGVQVFPYEKASELVQQQDLIAQVNCYCRNEAELLGKACGAPVDVCLVFGEMAEFVIEKGVGKKIAKEQAVDALKRAAEAGLVHSSFNSKQIGFICNCCGCCCGILGGITKLNSSYAVATSRFIASVDPDTCTACATCEEWCQIDAISVQDDISVVDEAKCIGCGVCTRFCPTESVTLKERADYTEPADSFVEVAVTIAKEKGKM